jgi:NCS1 family nucleobase:cation symporter-1
MSMVETSSSSAIEQRSIDYIPENERQGEVWHLGPMWFGTNANLTILATGVFGLSYGANLMWSVVAVVLGVSVGTFFMAFHSAQGPQLGLPQLIQSRAQFGFRGSLIVIPGVLVMYIGYNIFNLQLTGEAVSMIRGGTTTASPLVYVVGTVVALGVAIFGYRGIHGLQRVLTALFLVVFGFFTIAAVVSVDLPAGAMSLGNGFVGTAFLAQFSIAAASQLGWAPYVADYSRYLPARVGIRATFWWTYFGSMVSAVWLMCLGAFLVASTGDSSESPVAALKGIADDVAPWLGVVILCVAIPGLLSVTAVNIYCAGLSLLTVADSVKRIEPRLWHRLLGVTLVASVCLVGAVLSSGDFLATFYNVIMIMLYSFVPWTAINLLDYYVVRKGRYDIEAMFDPNGAYGMWNWRGLTAYGLGYLSMIPFVAIGWYTGPIANSLGGIDIAMFVGLPVSGILYLLLTRDERAEDVAGTGASLDTVPGSRRSPSVAVGESAPTA